MLTAKVLSEIVKNYAMGIPAVRRARLRKPRATSLATDAYVDRLLRDYIEPVRKLGIHGKSIIEIGPGDSLVTAFTFLAFGARSYTAIDRFETTYDSEEAQEWCAAMSRRIGALPDRNDPRISVVTKSVETAGDLGKFDIVCSIAVGEHVTSVPAFAAFTAHSLKPGGMALHIVDFSGHHWHRDDDPELFRRFPEWLWQAMGSNRGVPNRVTYEEFIEAFAAVGLDVHGSLRGTHGVIFARHH